MTYQDELSLNEKDKKYFFHPFTALKSHEETGSKFIVKAKGSTLFDIDGKSYLDSMAGLWCVNSGYGNEEMADAMSDQVKTLNYYHTFSAMSNDLAAELAEKLISMSPVPMAKVFYGNSGSDANDTNAKIIWFYNNALGRPQKKKIIARHRGYHGVTVLSGGLTGLKNLH
jgi:L-2,4-diaminobutyrate transaminase